VFICDLDVHQGDGTIAILNRHSLDNVFLLDVSCESNFPLRKQFPAKNGIVLQLSDGVQDADYLARLRESLAAVHERFGAPDVVLYQGGVDPLKSDALGKLGLSMTGLRQRDATVYEWAKRHAASVITTCGGGYAKDAQSREIVVSAHVQQIRELAFYS
jgi:acetoin utilization deacetylase AcuC-like enzyme